MTNATWISVSLGLALGVVYGIASFVSLRSAQRKQGSAFVKAALGGMAIRLLLATILIAAVLLFLPVDPLLFVVSFMGLYVLALVFEAYLLHSRVPASRQG